MQMPTRHAHNRPVGGESAPEKELTASRDLTASKKPRAQERSGLGTESVSHCFSIRQKIGHF